MVLLLKYSSIKICRTRTRNSSENINSDLNKAYELKVAFYTIVDNGEYSTAYNKLSSWIIDTKISLIGEFREAASTIENCPKTEKTLLIYYYFLYSYN